MSKNTDLGLLILRVGVSGLMLTHGLPKLLNLLQGNFDFPDPIGLGSMISLILIVIAEAICPVLILVGIKTRIATIPPIIAMAVAAFMVHGADPIGTKEKALLYLVAFIAIGLMGAGKLSLDRK
ncbi:DoxX family protein [uncultured Dokdonia sp.]|uniref:DoxX family protein n=1 Tax=uncultured Dokdonia sp. TaxID=575653 RepID=UPI00261F06A0|nr:DoxX family protein [uncultured Dokdonia sp.]